MSPETLTRASSAVALGAATLFFADLFFTWQRVSVDVAGVVNVEETASGWNGWGFAAGLFALVLIAVAISDLRGRSPAHGRSLAFAIVPAGLVLSTALAVFTGDASVDVAGTVGVEIDTTLWPAWTGLALAVIAAGAAFVPLVAELRNPARPGALPAASGLKQ